MTNQHGHAVIVNDNGIALNHSQGSVIAVATTSALVGNLTVTGITNTDGSPAAWVLTAGSNGVFTPPGSGKFFTSLVFTYANAADKGKAVGIYLPF